MNRLDDLNSPTSVCSFGKITIESCDVVGEDSSFARKYGKFPIFGGSDICQDQGNAYRSRPFPVVLPKSNKEQVWAAISKIIDRNDGVSLPILSNQYISNESKMPTINEDVGADRSTAKLLLFRDEGCSHNDRDTQVLTEQHVSAKSRMPTIDELTSRLLLLRDNGCFHYRENHDYNPRVNQLVRRTRKERRRSMKSSLLPTSFSIRSLPREIKLSKDC